MNNNSWLEVDRKIIFSNIHTINKKLGPKTKILAAIKSNAFGHGLLEIAEICYLSGIRHFGVKDSEEALILRKRYKDCLILIFYKTNLWEVYDLAKNDISISIYSLADAKSINEKLKMNNIKINVHIAIDTGMNWLGIGSEAALSTIKYINDNLTNLVIEGIYSNLGQAENNIKFTKIQIDTFKHIISTLEANYIHMRYKHIANSAGLFNFQESHLNMVDPGMSIFGIKPKGNYSDKGLKESLSLKTRVMQVKRICQGSFVGYGSKNKLKENKVIAIIPLGYYDGLNLALSNNYKVLIHGEEARIIGRIAMNISVIDVTRIENVRTGNIVTIIGRQGTRKKTVTEMSKILKTIPQEVFCNLSNNKVIKYFD